MYTTMSRIGLGFFCLVAGNYLLQAVREGLTYFVHEDTILEGLTGLASLLFSLLFIFFKVDQRASEIHIVLGVILAHLLACLGFALYFYYFAAPNSWNATVFFLTSSVGNVLTSSFLWGLVGHNMNRESLMFFSQCATLGQLFGSFASWALLDAFGRIPLLLFAAALLSCSLFCIHSTSLLPAHHNASKAAVAAGTVQNRRQVRHAMLYITMLCAFQMANSMSQTLVALRKRVVMVEMKQSAEQRAVLSSQMNAMSAAAILFVQFSGLLSLVSNQAALLASPILIGGGLLLQQYVGRESFASITGLVVGTRVTVLALGKPVRESLFGVLSTSDRIRIKPIVDGFVRDLGQILAAAFHSRFGEALLPQAVHIALFLALTLALTAPWEMKEKIQ